PAEERRRGHGTQRMPQPALADHRSAPPGRNRRHRSRPWPAQSGTAFRALLQHQVRRPGHGSEHLPYHHRIASRAPVGQSQSGRRDHIPLHPAQGPAPLPDHGHHGGTARMSDTQLSSTIYIVDDDEAVRDSLRWLLEANGYNVRSFAGPEEFRPAYGAEQVGVQIADTRMPGMSGLELQETLIARKAPLPIVFITGHGDVPMAVSTMKKGAVDFLEKPFNEADLRALVASMLEQARERVREAHAQRAQQAVLSRLTAREQQVLERIVAGRLNKQIAGDLNISIKTVEAHRANIMEKLEVTTVADLMKIALARAEEA